MGALPDTSPKGIYVILKETSSVLVVVEILPPYFSFNHYFFFVPLPSELIITGDFNIHIY